MKKKVTALIFACLITASAACGCSKASSSDTETTTVKATTAELTTAAIAFKEMKFRSMTYEVPESWALNTVTDTSTNSLDTGSDDSLLMIMYSDTDGEAVTASYLENTAEAVKLAYEDCTVLDEGAIIIDYNPAYKMEMTLTSNGEQYFWEQYMFGNSSDLYTVVFSSKGTSRSSTMNLYEDEIVNSIQLSEAATEKATEEPTIEEPTTEEPTTEKPTEAKDTIINNTSTGGFSAQGTGDYVAEGLTVTGYGVLKINHTGSSNFSVISYEGDDYDDLLVNTIGDYSGEVLINHSGTFSLEITADGSWSITSSGLSVDDSTSFSGTGDAVTGITTHDGGSWSITNSGESNFSVIQYGLSEGYMDLLVNEIGDYSGTVKGESGDDIFFAVTSDGSWTISKK